MAVSETDLHHIFAEAIVAGHPDSTSNPELIAGLAVNKNTGAPRITWHSNPRFSHLVFKDSDAPNSSKSGDKKMKIAVKSQLENVTSREEALEILQSKSYPW